MRITRLSSILILVVIASMFACSKSDKSRESSQISPESKPPDSIQASVKTIALKEEIHIGNIGFRVEDIQSSISNMGISIQMEGEDKPSGIYQFTVKASIKNLGANILTIKGANLISITPTGLITAPVAIPRDTMIIAYGETHTFERDVNSSSPDVIQFSVQIDKIDSEPVTFGPYRLGIGSSH